MKVEITSATHYGLDGILITVEVDISKGIPTFNIVGLPDTSVKEAKERVRAAILNSGFEFPLGRITVNLA
ncbi:MAG: magnesium chelatase domain-containing protein, partial [Clostridium sp.]